MSDGTIRYNETIQGWEIDRSMEPKWVPIQDAEVRILDCSDNVVIGRNATITSYDEWIITDDGITIGTQDSKIGEIRPGDLILYPGSNQASTEFGDVIIMKTEIEAIVTIHPDGNVDLNPDYTYEEAALAFWDAVAGSNPKYLESKIKVLENKVMLYESK